MKTILLIDSGYLKNVFKNNSKFYDADGIEEISKHIICSIKAQQHSLIILNCLIFFILQFLKSKIKLYMCILKKIIQNLEIFYMGILYYIMQLNITSFLQIKYYSLDLILRHKLYQPKFRAVHL